MYSKAEYQKNPGSEGKGIFKCMLCYKFQQMKPMHKFLRALLNDLKFKCPDCLRVLTYERMKGHKGRGECQRGLASMEEAEEDAVMEQFQPNAQQNVALIKSLYILERDSKFIHEYVL